MARTQFLKFTIALTDAELVKEYQAKNWFTGPLGETMPGVVNRAPLAAATEFGAPFLGWKDPKGEGPYSWSPWAWDGLGGSNGPYPLNVATFQRKTGGFWGLFKTTVKYYWMGEFVYVPGAAPGVEPGGTPTPLPLRQRKWLQGFELPLNGGGITGGSNIPSRDASRHPDGYGCALRSVTNSEIIQSTTAFGVAADGTTWERIYIRLRRAPNGGTGRFWKATGSISSASGATLEITSDRRLANYRLDGGGVSYLMATSAAQLEIGRYYKLDILHHWALNAGRMTIYLDGKPFLDVAHTVNSGLGQAQAHATSTLGSNTSTFNMDLDLDDWVGCKYPAPPVAGGPFSIIQSVDWQQGTKIVAARARGFGANHNVAWTGDWRKLLAIPAYQSAGGFPLTSSTSGAILEVETDADDVADAAPYAIGTAAIGISALTARGGAAVGSLGYIRAGGAAVDAAITAEGLTRGWANVIYNPAALAAPHETITPLRLRYIKGADASAASCWGIYAQIDLVGTFAACDQSPIISGEDPVPEAPESMGIHNAPYPRSPWAYSSKVPPTMPVVIIAGTYVGNGSGIDETGFPVPPCWIYTRPVSVASHAGGNQWWSSMIGAHLAMSQGIEPSALVEAIIDPDYAGAGDVLDAQQSRALIRRMGDQGQANQNTAVYQYVAFCDPAMRFCLNGAIAQRTGAPTVINDLIDAFFDPDWGWFMGEADTGTGGATKMYFKGPGHPAATWQLVNGAEEGAALTMNVGSIETTNVVHDDTVYNHAYSLFREDDHSDDPGVGFIRCVQWAGDGNASRTIGFVGGGRAPLFVFASSRTAPSGGFQRDPSHTTNTSHAITGGGASSTAITGGGVDFITVGSSLNAAGQNYQAFIILGGAAGPNGFSINGTYVPVDPGTAPENGPWPPLPPEPVGPPPADEEPPAPIEQPPDLADDLEACPVETHRFCNLALARVGVSQQVNDLSVDEDGIPAESSQEAVQLRLHYSEAIRATLRDFPWPFATAYADLEVVDGDGVTPVNGDWTFSYRKPGDCVFERRLVVARNGAIDPEPPPFYLSADDEGGLIFANEEDAELEYTRRPLCVAVHGDALFVEAALWRLAAAIAPALSRMTEKVDYCMSQYEKAIAKAELVIKPGNPGTSTVGALAGDAAAGCMEANVVVANMALVRLGAKTITSLSDQSREARTVRLVFEQELRAVLREFPWPFATRYTDAPTFVEGTLEDPTNADWTYAYRVPTGAIYVRRLVTSTGRGYDASPFPFRRGSDATGGIIYTNEEEPILEYTIRPDCAVSQGDEMFREALSWRLQFTIAPSLLQFDPRQGEQQGRGPEHVTKGRVAPATEATFRERAQRFAWFMYQDTLERAKVAAANEGQRNLDDEIDAPWIDGR